MEDTCLITQERKDCIEALTALAGANVATPAKGYGTNVSWAISDLCRAVKDLHGRLIRAEAALESKEGGANAPGH